MSFVKFRIKAEQGFKDGNIFPRALHVGEVLVVDEVTYLQMKASDPSIVLLEKVVPVLKKKVEPEPEVAAPPKKPASKKKQDDGA
jgi:hypothetical protein